MKQVYISAFRKMGMKEMMEASPVTLFFEGNPFGYFGRLEDVIIIADLHPRVQKQFKAMEQRVRLGMPPPEPPEPFSSKKPNSEPAQE